MKLIINQRINKWLSFWDFFIWNVLYLSFFFTCSFIRTTRIWKTSLYFALSCHNLKNKIFTYKPMMEQVLYVSTEWTTNFHFKEFSICLLHTLLCHPLELALVAYAKGVIIIRIFLLSSLQFQILLYFLARVMVNLNKPKWNI